MVSPERFGPVKVLVQQNKSHRYYRGEGDWVTERTNACDFGNTLKALKVTQQEKLDDVCIVLTFAHSRSDLRLPIGENRPRSRLNL